MTKGAAKTVRSIGLPERRRSRHQSADGDEYRRHEPRRGDLGERRTDHAGACRRARFQARAQLLHPRWRGDRHRDGNAERTHRGGADRHRAAAAIRPRGASRITCRPASRSTIRSSSRRPTPGGSNWIDHAADPVHTAFRDNRFVAAFERRTDSHPLYRVAYVVRAVSPGSYVLPQARGGGHVPARPFRPHRHGRRHGDDRRDECSRGLQAVGPTYAAMAEGELWRGSMPPSAQTDRAAASGPPSASRSPTVRRRSVRSSKSRPDVLDRNGQLLRAYLTDEGRWRLPATRDDVDPRFLDALLAYEDKQFFSHHGVDPLAMMRAAYQLASQGAHHFRGLDDDHAGGAAARATAGTVGLGEAAATVRALQLEWALSKDEILSLYLTLAPYGGNLEGIRAASLAYFGKEPRRLTLGEAALLVALPQSPEYRAARPLCRKGARCAQPRARPYRRRWRRSAPRRSRRPKPSRCPMRASPCRSARLMPRTRR